MSAQEYEVLFEENPQPMWVLDSDGQQFLAVNAAALRLYGYTAEEFGTMRLADLVSAEPAAASGGGGPAAQSIGVSGEKKTRHRSKDGRTIEVEMPVREIEFGGRKAWLAVLLDAGGRRRLEEQLRQAQKMEAVGMLAGGVAHDFNNLLTIIAGYSQLILNNLAPGDRNRSSVEHIMKAGEQAAALTRQLLSFSRREAVQPRVLELNKLVRSLSAMLRRLIGEDVDLRLELGSEAGRVSADPGQIEQVLMNLAANARDAMPGGGTLTLETAGAELADGHYAMLAVSDTGQGMDAATQARLCEPFFTTKDSGKGTGLGLATVFAIVQQNGGSLRVNSEPGLGTTVRVYLPRIDRPAVPDTGGSIEPVRRGTETILVVEDDDSVRHVVREALQRAGYTILDARGPVEARRIARRFRGPIHLLITDVVMPKVNGRDLAAQLTRRRPAMKVLYMSGYTDSAILNSGILQREVAFLEKPFTPPALTAKVRQTLDSDSLIHQAGQ